MNTFLVLGLVPGTGFQITFIEWLSALILAVGAAILFIAHHQHPHKPSPEKAEISFISEPRPSFVGLWLKSAARRFEVRLLSAYARLLAPLTMLTPEGHTASSDDFESPDDSL